jgi:hypothetical protein
MYLWLSAPAWFTAIHVSLALCPCMVYSYTCISGSLPLHGLQLYMYLWLSATDFLYMYLWLSVPAWFTAIHVPLALCPCMVYSYTCISGSLPLHGLQQQIFLRVSKTAVNVPGLHNVY